MRTVTHSHRQHEPCNALSCPVAAAHAKYPHSEKVIAKWPADTRLVCTFKGSPVRECDLQDGIGVAILHAFEGRKGHGGGVPITKRVMTQEQLRRFAFDAIRSSLNVGRGRALGTIKEQAELLTECPPTT